MTKAKSLLITLGGELINRNFSSLETEVSGIALQPEESTTQPEFPTSVQLYFNIDKSVKSSYRLRGGYKYPEDTDIRTLNKYADALQRSAQQYLDRFANQKIIYAFNEDNQLNALSPVALRYPLNICSLSSITEGINFKSIKKPLTKVKSHLTLGANCSIAISVL